MQLVMSTGCLYHLPAQKTFEIARDIGFDGVEVIINYDFGDPPKDYIARVEQLQKIHPILSLHAPFLDINGWGNKMRQLRRTVDLAIAVGVPRLTFHPPSWLGGQWKFFRWLNRVEDFQVQVGRGKVLITIENMPSTGPFHCNPYCWGKTRSMIDFINQKNLFLTFDTAHMGSSKADFISDFHQFYNSGRMRNIHFSDYGYGREHLLPGHGVLPLTRFLNHLRNTGYNETVVLELSPRELPKEEDAIRERMQDVFDYLHQETHVDWGEGELGDVSERGRGEFSALYRQSSGHPWQL